MASSIVQGGPAPDFLSVCYTYLSFGIESITVNEKKVEDQSARHLLNRVSIFIKLMCCIHRQCRNTNKKY